MPSAIFLRRDASAPEYHALELRGVDPGKTNNNVAVDEDLVAVRIDAAALNHRDLYQRQSLYPGISFSTPILADGVGTVRAVHRSQQPASASVSSPSPSPGERVLINPGVGWESRAEGPEGAYTVIGGTSTSKLGTLSEEIKLPAADVAPCPKHLSDAEAAALPLAGLTAWRAFVSKSGAAKPGHNIFVTGIGGGVALMALQFGVAMGCNVFVSSSSADKIEHAVKLGAAGGVDYRQDDWPKRLAKLLPKSRPYLDAAIDGAGGDIVSQLFRCLKMGAVVVSYGITTFEAPQLPMQAVMKNVEIRGSTMGSRREFRDMVRFVDEKRIVPVVDEVVSGIANLEGIERLFEKMKAGKHFGKLVVVLDDKKSKL